MAAFFEKHRYVVVPGALAPDVVDRLNNLIDRSRRENADLWYTNKPHQHFTVQAMLVEQGFDFLLRQPPLFDTAKQALDDDIAFVEFSARIHGPQIKPETTNGGWHQDVPCNPSQRLGIRLLSVIYYLSDVEHTGHRFVLLPASQNLSSLPPTVGNGSLEVQGEVEIVGPAGTAVLFDASIWHGARHGNNGRERRTVHLYYQPASLPAQTEFTLLPRRLWNSSDIDMRKLCSVSNAMTRAARASVGRDGSAGSSELQLAAAHRKVNQ